MVRFGREAVLIRHLVGQSCVLVLYMAPTAFISYAHDTEAHKVRVQTLADQLRHDGVDAMIDQYESHPPEGWPKWMEKQMTRSYLLIVPSPRYVYSFEQAETSIGGARYEVLFCLHDYSDEV
jgi:TIR domain-containing protein